MFVTVASHEGRALADVLDEALTEQAERWSRTRHTLHLDPRDQALLDAYLDRLALDGEHLERMEEEAAYRAATTPMMQAAARASEERESFRTEDDRADLWQSYGGHEGVELRCALQD